MPFDGQSYRKGEPFSVESLIAWLETMNPYTGHDYAEPGECLVAQYTVAMGGEIGDVTYKLGSKECPLLLPLELQRVAHPTGNICGKGYVYDPTFGGALKRAREVLAEKVI